MVYGVLQRYVHVTVLLPIASTKKLELLSSFLSHPWCLLTTPQEDGTLISSWNSTFNWTEDTHENRGSTVPLLQSDFIAVGSETAILRFAYCGKRTNLLSSEKRVRFPYPFPRAPSFFSVALLPLAIDYFSAASRTPSASYAPGSPRYFPPTH